MGTLKQDIKTASKFIIKAFNSDKLYLDYTVASFKNLDNFFDQHTINGKAKKNGRLSTNLGQIIFAVAAYVGETFIKNFPGSEWITDDSDPKGELTIQIKFQNGSIIWPMQRVMKRFQNGPEDGLYVYGLAIAQELGFEMSAISTKNKPWWKFW